MQQSQTGQWIMDSHTPTNVKKTETLDNWVGDTYFLLQFNDGYRSG